MPYIIGSASMSIVILKDLDSLRRETRTARDPFAPAFIIPNNFSRLCRSIDARKVLGFLSDECLLSSSDVDYCKELVDTAFVTLRLLRLLDEKGQAGDDLLRRALHATQQEQVVTELWGTLPALTVEDPGHSLSTGGRQVQILDDTSTPSWNVTVLQETASEEKSNVPSSAISYDRSFGGRSEVVTNPPSFAASLSPTSLGTRSSVPAMTPKPQNLELSANASGGSGSGRQSNPGVQTPAFGFQSESGTSSESVNIARGNGNRLLLEKQQQVGTPVPQQNLMRPVIPGNLPAWSQSASPASPPLQRPQMEGKGEPQVQTIACLFKTLCCNGLVFQDPPNFRSQVLSHREGYRPIQRPSC